MNRRPYILEVSCGRRHSEGWVVLVGREGAWEEVPGRYRRKSECRKAMTRVARALRRDDRLMAALREAVRRQG